MRRLLLAFLVGALLLGTADAGTPREETKRYIAGPFGDVSACAGLFAQKGSVCFKLDGTERWMNVTIRDDHIHHPNAYYRFWFGGGVQSHPVPICTAREGIEVPPGANFVTVTLAGATSLVDSFFHCHGGQLATTGAITASFT